MNWVPMLNGREAAKALETVHDIASALKFAPPSRYEGLVGAGGTALFLAYAESAGVADDFGAERALAESVRALADAPLSLGLWMGCAGLRWMISHLVDHIDARDVLARLDNKIIAALTSPSENLEFDLLSGVAGVILAYAGERSDTSFRVVSLALDRLFLVEWSQQHEGCAHGIAGVVSALAHCVTADVQSERASVLLRPLLQRLHQGAATGMRASWCNGDLGISLALLAGGRALRESRCEERAIERAIASSAAMSCTATVDMTLCHGATGLAHLYNRMFQTTGNAALCGYAKYWLRILLQNHRRSRTAKDDHLRATEYSRSSSLLVGSAGIGMVLLASATTLVPSWDCLLGAGAWGAEH